MQNVIFCRTLVSQQCLRGQPHSRKSGLGVTCRSTPTFWG